MVEIKASCQHLIKFMLTFELTETDKHSTKILLRRKNLRFLRRTNLIKTRCQPFEKNHNLN